MEPEGQTQKNGVSSAGSLSLASARVPLLLAERREIEDDMTAAARALRSNGEQMADSRPSCEQLEQADREARAQACRAAELAVELALERQGRVIDSDKAA